MRVHEFADEAERRRIPVTVDLDMIVGRDSAALPAGEDVRLDWEFAKLGAVDLGEDFGTAWTEAAHRTGIEFGDEDSDGGIQLCEREEVLIAQPRQDSSLGDLHGDLDLRLVLRLLRPCREDRRTVMARHLGVGAVETGIVAVGIGDGGLQGDCQEFRVWVGG